MKEFNTAEELVSCFLEEWNDRHPDKKLDGDLIDYFETYLRLAYVSGWDDFRILAEQKLKISGKDGQFSKSLFLAYIKNFDKNKNNQP